jgi:hypothetical protein
MTLYNPIDNRMPTNEPQARRRTNKNKNRNKNKNKNKTLGNKKRI